MRWPEWQQDNHRSRGPTASETRLGISTNLGERIETWLNMGRT